MKFVLLLISFLPCLLTAAPGQYNDQLLLALQKYINASSAAEMLSVMTEDSMPVGERRFLDQMLAVRPDETEFRIIFITDIAQLNTVIVNYETSKNDVNSKHLIVMHRFGDDYKVFKTREPYSDELYLCTLNWILREVSHEEYELVRKENRENKRFEIIRNLQQRAE